ncbi:MAG: hypothetical protein J6Y03_04755 [Alphaproteobacteria bacterium]|nr:hypothetical protein [Alphaproteobacteria bacterium]
MKQRLIAYFIFLPIILLAGFTDIDVFLKYLAIASIPLSIGLLIYMFIKTKQFYKIKKVLLFAFVIGCLFVPNISSAQVEIWDADNTYMSEQEYVTAVRLVYELEKIPRELRTEAQQKEYEEAKKKMHELAKKLNVPAPCPSATELHSELVSSCWACDIANLFIEATNKVASNLYTLDKKNGYAKSLLALGFFFWILIHVIKLIMSFGRGDIGAFFTDLFLKILLVGGIFILLTLPMKKIIDFFISPFFLFSATMSQEIQQTAAPDKIPEMFSSVSGVSSSDQKEIKQNVNSMLKGLTCHYCQNLDRDNRDERDEKISSLLKYNPRGSEGRVVSPLLRNSLLCTVCTIYNATVQPTVSGQFLLCNAKRETSCIPFTSICWYSNLNGIIVGLLLVFTFFSIAAVFSFYLIDTFFRIALVLVLLPFLIVAGAFKSTMVYTKKGFEVIIHSVFTYIVISLFMTLTVQIFYFLLGKQSVAIIKATYSNNYQKLNELVKFGNSENHVVLACFGIAIIVFFMMKQLDYYITTISGIKLNNSGGFQSATIPVAMGAGAAKAISDTYNQKWKKGGNGTDNSPEDKASKIRQWGEDTSDGKAEKTTDSAADGIDKLGEKGAEKLNESGKSDVKNGASNVASGIGACFTGAGVLAGLGKAALGIGQMAMGAGKMLGALAVKAVSKAAAITVKYGSRAVIKSAKYLNPAKVIARNKYFNKTVGLFWQIGSDVKNAPQNIRNSWKRTKERLGRAKEWAKKKYRRH